MATKTHGFLSRGRMESVIKGGGAVLRSRAKPGERVITKTEHIPNDAQLALQSNDPEQIEAAKARIAKQKEDLDVQLASLENPDLGKEDESIGNAEATTDLDVSTAVLGSVENVQKPGADPGSPDVAEDNADEG